jgi:predicted aspartyl protease
VIRYRYAMEAQPPAPFVNVTVRCPTTGRHVEQSLAQVDPGADCTVLPSSVVTALALVQVGLYECRGFHGEIVLLPVFLVKVSIHDLPAVEVRAVLGERESYILLGRYVLNAHRIVLDGPRLALEIG